MSVIIRSTQDSRFVTPRNFCSIPAVSEAAGISLRAVRSAYHSGRTSIKKASGEVYTLKWMEPVAPIDTSKCKHSFLAGVESADQCLLNSKVLSCFSGVIMSIRSFFLLP